MRQYRGHFAFRFGRQQQTAMYADIAAGAGKGVDAGIEHHKKVKPRCLRIGAGKQTISQ